MKSNFLHTTLLLCATVMASVTFLSCNDDEKASTKPVLLGAYREPYVYEIQQENSTSGTSHYFTVRYFSIMVFPQNDNTVQIITVYSKNSMEELKSMEEYKDATWYQLNNDTGKPIDWYSKGEPSFYTYVIDYERNIAMFSNGETYELTVDSKSDGRLYESLTSSKGPVMFIKGKRYTNDKGQEVIGSGIDDDEYNNKTWFQWLNEYFANKNR